jgi:hypothetical protein
MKNAALIVLVYGLVCLVNPARVLSQEFNLHSPVTLYSTIKHRDEHRNACLNLLTGAPESHARNGRCDVSYGSLYAGDDLDWLESSTSLGQRSVIRDLGSQSWTAEFKIPVVAPLARLKPGEQRTITVDTSGADARSVDHIRDIREDPDWSYRPGVNNKPRRSSQSKHDGKPRVDPKFVKAIVGHMYVIHVVDDVRDIYALFRVEALERGDNCTISWKFIPAPDSQTRRP